MSLDLTALRDAYRAGRLRPTHVVDSVMQAVDQHAENPVWISRVAPEALYARAAALGGLDPFSLPLYGVPFAVKDNIDVAQMPTTAGCPAYARTPSRDATAVRKLLDAGAILVGKTNLDQFATGLTGSRSPYGACRNPFDKRYIAGGSSSGSAVAVATGMASFALGTDTAGSGRVPAAFNNVVGLKPSRGIVSAAGVVPACRSLDCVSIFALTVADASEVLAVVRGADPDDPYSREAPSVPRVVGPAFRFGLPRPSQLEFFGDRDAERQFDSAVSRMRDIGGIAVQIDLAPFRAVGEMLYGGPWGAERYAGNREFLDASAQALLPVTREIIMGAARYSAADAFRAMYELKRIERAVAPVWQDVDFIVLPTTPTIYRIDEIE
ncbi:MAG: allophanate hydrolase, partial [Usitatibacter sp.]